MVKLVLVRHGESVWNQMNEFTGWVDVPITKKGEDEAKEAGARLLRINFDVAFTSQLVRAHQTLCTIFQERTDEILVFKHNLGKAHLWEHYSNKHPWEIPVFKAQALNERYYGDLQGLNKQETKNKYGDEQVHKWRRGFTDRPPNGENLADVYNRTTPYYEQHILPFIRQGKNVIIVAHGNSLRALVMYLEHYTPQQIENFELKTGVPMVFDLDAEGKVLTRQVLT